VKEHQEEYFTRHALVLDTAAAATMDEAFENAVSIAASFAVASRGADSLLDLLFVGGDAHRVLFFWHYVVNRGLTLLSNLLTNLNLTDMEIGYKAFRREVLQKISIEENRFGVEPEITAKVARLHCRIYEVGVSYSGRTYSEGKKVGWRDGLHAAWCVLKYNLRPRYLER